MHKKVYYLVAMKKLPDTVTNEHRTNIVNLNYAKCRANKLKVIDIKKFNPKTLKLYKDEINECINLRYGTTKYIKGEIVYPNNFDENEKLVCSSGIHYFVNKKQALMYHFSLRGQTQLFYRNGLFDKKKNNVIIHWNDDGKLLRRFSYYDPNCGLCEEWYENGTMCYRAKFRNKRYYGQYESWHENGVIDKKYGIRDGQYHGNYESWDNKGKLCTTGFFKYGKKYGEFKIWSHDTDIIKTECWINDILINTSFNNDKKGYRRNAEQDGQSLSKRRRV
jgi:antitoxin component YwqK of YwqJK toxin-antitoxin module